ncbi:MAG: GspE/PulE family protein [Burkholderiaceae bacterium]
MSAAVVPIGARVARFTAAQLREARAMAEAAGQRAISTLEEASGLPPAEFITRLGATLGYATLSAAELGNARPDFDVLPYPEAARRECAAVRVGDDPLLLVFADPFQADLQAWADHRIDAVFEWRLVHHEELAVFLRRHEESLRALDEVRPEDELSVTTDGTQDLSLVAISEDDSPVVKIVNSTLYDALKAGASDIHVESRARDLSIKYRIDGVLNPVRMVSGREQSEQVISRIKVMAELDISETRVPQDGRFKVRSRGREIDVRVSVMPSIFGEDAVLRILDKQALSDHLQGLTLTSLGFDNDTIVAIRRLSREPYGMLLVTGPTGSGKTTSLYAAISEINRGEDKIVTIEDPVEYQLPNVLQIPVNEKKGLTFARGLRSILRHDPDRIMVGEIRDAETAQIAVQAALTGHLVFTTVHANNVFDVIGRFLHMGVDPYNFVSALKGVVAQRLVRLNCTECSEPVQPEEELLDASGIRMQDAANFNFMHGKGCGACRGTGYKGRRAIGEVLRMNDELSEMIAARATGPALRAAAVRAGLRTMRVIALQMVRDGQTTLEEINRVTAVE